MSVIDFIVPTDIFNINKKFYPLGIVTISAVGNYEK